MKLDLTYFRNLMSPKFRFLLNETSRNVVLRGGSGGSKSYSVMQNLIYNILKDLNDSDNVHNFLCLRKTLPAARKSLYPLLRHLVYKYKLPDNKLVKINKSDYTIEFINGSKIMIGGLDNPEKIKSLFGVDKIFMEEATEFTLEDYRQLQLRLRGEEGRLYQLFLAFNPTSRLNWVYDEFYRKEKPNTVLHHSTYLDNPYLDGEYKVQMQDLINQDINYHRIYCLGEWGVLGSAIYTNWEVTTWYPKCKIVQEAFGLDFGYSNPTALVQVGETGETKNTLFAKELIYKPGLTTQALIYELYLHVVTPGESIIYADGSLPGVIEEIRQAGFNIVAADKKPHSVREGIDLVKRKKLLLTKNSPNFIKEIQSYSYQIDKATGLAREEPIKVNDHLCDALRYAITGGWGQKARVGVRSLEDDEPETEKEEDNEDF